MNKIHKLIALVAVAFLSVFLYLEVNSKTSSTDVFSSGNRTLDTSYLPLKLVEYQIPTGIFGAPEAAGITLCGQKLLAYNRLGDIFEVQFRNKVISVSKVVTLNMGLDNFKETKKYKLNQSTFRLHKIYCDRKSKRLYATYEYFDGENARYRLSYIEELSISKVNLKSKWVLAWQSQPYVYDEYIGAAGGGGINEDETGAIVFAIGDYNLDGVINKSWPNNPGYIAAQDLKSEYGKSYKFTPRDSSVVLYTVGHRNPQAIEYAGNAELFSVEHGPQGGDKLLMLKEGANYGWPHNTLGNHYGTYQWGQRRPSKHYAQAIFNFVPSIGISSIRQVVGFNEKWDGDLIVGSLKAQTLYRTRINASRTGIEFLEPIFIGERVRDVVFYSGKMILMTDKAQLLVLVVDDIKYKSNGTNQHIKYAAMDVCMRCHHLGVTNPTSMAPTLAGILRRNMASDDGYGSRYSSEFKTHASEIWTKENLKSFIRNPESFGAKGMPQITLSEEQIKTLLEVMEGL